MCYIQIGWNKFLTWKIMGSNLSMYVHVIEGTSLFDNSNTKKIDFSVDTVIIDGVCSCKIWYWYVDEMDLKSNWKRGYKMSLKLKCIMFTY